METQLWQVQAVARPEKFNFGTHIPVVVVASREEAQAFAEQQHGSSLTWRDQDGWWEHDEEIEDRFASRLGGVPVIVYYWIVRPYSLGDVLLTDWWELFMPFWSVYEMIADD